MKNSKEKEKEIKVAENILKDPSFYAYMTHVAEEDLIAETEAELKELKELTFDDTKDADDRLTVDDTFNDDVDRDFQSFQLLQFPVDEMELHVSSDEFQCTYCGEILLKKCDAGEGICDECVADIQEQALKAEMLKKSDIDIDAVVTDTDSHTLTDAFIDVCKVIEFGLDELERDEACDYVSVKDELRSSSCILEDILFKIKVHNNSFDSKGYVLPDFSRSGAIQERLDVLCEKLDVNIIDIRSHYASRTYKDERPIKMDSKRGSTGCFVLVVLFVAALTLLATMCDSGAITKDEQEVVGDAVTEQAQKVKAVIDDNGYRVDRFKNYINKLSGE